MFPKKERYFQNKTKKAVQNTNNELIVKKTRAAKLTGEGRGNSIG